MLPDLILLVANVVYATSYVVTRVTLEDIPPAMLALARLIIGAAVLMPVALARRRSDSVPVSRTDRWSIFWMGAIGFAGAFAFAHWGIARSTATNAALLITVEPVSLILRSPLTLGERLSRLEVIGALLAVIGATLVVLSGIPGVTQALVPHWRGDVLLVLSGLAHASYSLFGRDVLARYPALEVTAWSILWGSVAMVPLALAEWIGGLRPLWTKAAVAGTAYLALVITALGYLAWNYALERVKAPRAAIFLNLQPLVGALLGMLLLGERVSIFTVVGGLLIVAGLCLTVKTSAAR